MNLRPFRLLVQKLYIGYQIDPHTLARLELEAVIPPDDFKDLKELLTYNGHDFPYELHLVPKKEKKK